MNDLAILLHIVLVIVALTAPVIVGVRALEGSKLDAYA